MKKFAKIMLMALGVGLVAGAIGVLTSSPTTAQLPPPPIPVVPVKVTNTPLPITGNVDVTNSNCNNVPHLTLSNFLAGLDPDKASTIRVSGTCTDNLHINGINRLTLLAAPGGRQSLNKECGWKGGDRGGLAERQRDRTNHGKPKTLTGKSKTNS